MRCLLGKVPRRTRWTLVIIALVLLALIPNVAVWFKVSGQAHDLERKSGELDKALSTVNALASALDTQRAASAAQGDQPVTPPASAIIGNSPLIITGERGPEGKPGPGPTDAQVAMAVSLWMAQYPPSTGRPPTVDEIAGAVAGWCKVHGDCVGPRGSDGRDAEPVTAGQIASAVAGYCDARGGCAGPSGPMGGLGPQGPAIPSFAFTDASGQRQTCSDPDPENGLQYECVVVAPFVTTTTTAPTTTVP